MVPVSVTFLRYIQVENPDPAAGNGDYYGAVCWNRACDVRDCPITVGCAILPPDAQTPVFSNADDVSMFETVTRTFDRSVTSSIRVEVNVWDFDPGVFNSPDDVMDINPVNNAVSLTFSVNLNTGAWTEVTGAITLDTGFGAGDGDTGEGFIGPGGERGRLLFAISLSDDGDGDDDGIPDGLERTQVRDGNGTVVASLASLGADPCRKTVAVEIDFMESAGANHSHRPKPAALAEAKQAFADAPVPVQGNCPYRGPSPYPTGKGVNLVLNVDDAVAEQATLGSSSRTACTVGLVSIRDTAGFFNPALRPFFHYGLWAHDLASGITNGGVQCRSTSGRDFIVSLGSWRRTCVSPGSNGSLETTAGGDDVVVGKRIDNGPNRTCESTAVGDDRQLIPVGTGSTDDQVGTVRDQSAGFMHELGHALGLGHGGVEAITQTGNAVVNFKSNYLSVMNYLFATTGIRNLLTGVSRIDYSQSQLPALDRTNLNENAGISDGDDQTAWFDPAGNLRAGRGNLPLDWNFNNGGVGPFDTSVSVDINGSSRCISAGGAVQTKPATGSDDVVNAAGNAIVNGADDACQTTTPASGEVFEVDPDRPCVATGTDNALTTSKLSGSDDVELKRWIGVGALGICDTTADTADVQATPVGTSEPTVALTGSDDWAGLDYSDGLAGVGNPLRLATSATHADITAGQAEELEVFWRDAATVPGVTVGSQAPLTGPVVARFTETVEGVTSDNVVLRRAGAAQPLPVTRTCRDRSGSVVGCASRNVALVELRPGAPLVPGEHYEVTVNPAGVRPVTDLAGNAVTTTQFPLRGSLHESEHSVAAIYQWQPLKQANAAGGSYTREHLNGATASFRFNGTSITWYTVTGPDQGLADVLIDGSLVQTLDQYDTTTSYQVPRTFGGLTPGWHTITIRATGQAKPAATDTFVSIDAFRVGEDLFDTPEGDYRWQPNSAFEDIPSEYDRTDLRSSQVAFRFRGTGVTLFTVQGPSYGKFTVLIDGKPAGLFDSYKATTSYAVPIAFGGLTDAPHTITLVVAGQAQPASTGTFVAVDGWSVQ